MKRFTIRFLALTLVGAMGLSLAGCSLLGGSSRRKRDKDDDDDDDGPKWFIAETSESDPEPTEPSATTLIEPTQAPVRPSGSWVVETSDELTYPDHVATYDEIHPSRPQGTVKGDEAKAIVDACEAQLITYNIDCYADADILFQDPEALGIDVSDVSWGDGYTSIEEYEEKKEFYEGILEQLYTIDSSTLDREDLICYEKMVYDCEMDVYCYSYTAFNYYTMIFNYLVGPQSDIMFVLDVFTFDTVEDAENYILLLKDIDRYFGEMCDYEEERVAYGFISSDNSYEEAAKSFDNLVAMEEDCFLYQSFEERLDNIPNLSDSDRDRLIEENEQVMHDEVFPAFQNCADTMRALKGSGGEDYGLWAYRGGDAYYSALCISQSNSCMSVEDSMELCESYLDDLSSELTSITQGGDSSWINEYMEHEYTKGSVPDDLSFLYDAVEPDFPSIPAHEYYLMDVPECFEENFSPAAYLGYHLDQFDSNLIIVNNGSSDSDIGITLAHEGYPGHMFQSLYTRSATEHPYMYLFDSTGYAEGWAVYVENYAYKYYADTPDSAGARVVAIENELNVILGTMMDYGIHVKGWTLTDCADCFNDVFGGGVSESALQELYTLVVTDPCYYVKYGMGYIHTAEIMSGAHGQFPNASDEEIHTAYLDALTTNFEQIETNMYEDLAN